MHERHKWLERELRNVEVAKVQNYEVRARCIYDFTFRHSKIKDEKLLRN